MTNEDQQNTEQRKRGQHGISRTHEWPKTERKPTQTKPPFRTVNGGLGATCNKVDAHAYMRNETPYSYPANRHHVVHLDMHINTHTHMNTPQPTHIHRATQAHTHTRNKRVSITTQKRTHIHAQHTYTCTQAQKEHITTHVQMHMRAQTDIST